jgi:hypothetical protein
MIKVVTVTRVYWIVACVVYTSREAAVEALTGSR